jgi:hypothetical protein
MDKTAHYILLKNDTILSKKEYKHWREIQDEYYGEFMANLGPWTYKQTIQYFEDDFMDESRWPFSKESLIKFYEGNEMILHSN